MPAFEIYIDTSVIGGYFDDEFKEETRRLWELAEEGIYEMVTSVVTVDEISGAPAKVKDLFARSFDVDSLLLASEAGDELAEFYMSQEIVPEKFFDDAQHVAICTVARIEYLVSWNFKHLANLQRENAFNAANLLRGYREVRIVSPKSLVYGLEEEI